jgi:hypothetical protein
MKGNAEIALMPAAAAAAPTSHLLHPHARALEHAASTRSMPRRLSLRDHPCSSQRPLALDIPPTFLTPYYDIVTR